jgi:putative transcriptional regulator
MKSNAFNKLMQGLQEARDHAQGKHVPGLRVHHIEVNRNSIATLRIREGMTQAQFAQLLGTSLGTVRKWESGERSPSGAAARLIQLLEAKPKLVTKTLGVLPVAAKRLPRGSLAAAE